MALKNWEDIFNNAPCGLHSIDNTGTYIEINDTELGWLGYTREEVLGKLKFLDLITEESQKRFLQLFPAFIITGHVRDEEFEMVCKDGSLLPVLINSNANYNENGEFINTTAYVVNITNTKRVQEKLNRKTRSLEILNSIGKSISEELDLQNILQKVTDATTSLTHAEFGAFFYTAINAQGEAFQLYTLSGAPREAFEKFGVPRATAVFHPTFSGQGIVRVDDITKDERYGKNKPHNGMPAGHLPVKSYLAVPVITKSGEVIGGLFFGHSSPAVFTEESEDLVVGVASQAAIAIDNARLFENVSRTNEENKRLLELSKKSERKKDEFLSIASHELKTPLTSIKAYIQLLDKATNQTPSSNLFVKKAGLHIQRMERLISDLLDVSKINADNLSFKIDFFNFNEAVDECIENAKHNFATHSMVVKNNPQLQVLGDRVRIEQVINNFISNAIKYSPNADKIEINIAINNNNLVFSVKDFGIGIYQEHINKIFDRFYRVEETSMRYQGLGLGLFIAGEILRSHQGSFWLESQPGEGSTFYFSLPINRVSAPQPVLENNFYEDDFIKVSVCDDYIEAIWKGAQHYDSVMMGGKLISDLVVATGCRKILNDNSRVIGNWAAATEEGRKIWFPALEQAGLKYFAWVHFNGNFNRLAAEISISQPVGQLEIKYFNTRIEAEAWLNAL